MKKIVKLFIFVILALCTCCINHCSAFQLSGPSYTNSVRASHILVDTKEEAQVIKSKLDKGESFEAWAKKYSKCPSGQNGGDLGYFQRHQMVKPFEDAAFNLPIGKVSDPVETQFGWHLIKVIDKK